MSRMRIGFVCALLGTLAIWGCAQKPSSDSGKSGKLQDELRAMTAQRDQFSREVRSLKEEQDRLKEELAKIRLVVKERDELRRELAARTAERDAGVAQVEQIRKGLRSLMEQADAALTPGGPPFSAEGKKPAGSS